MTTQRGKPIFDAPGDPAYPRHLWAGKGLVPICRYCSVDSVTAQKQQPTTQGAGPCPLAPL